MIDFSTSGMLPCTSVLRSLRKHSTQYTDTAYGLSLIRYMENPKKVKKEISGIHWNFTTMLEDFDFVDDIAQ